jgi:TM2 domain-containing membrane protein YozV
MKYCQNCGAQIDERAVICPKCGVPIAGAKEPKSRTVAIILALFAGGFGIHKLYLGVGRWWLYLLFFWTLIPALIALVEMIQYIMMSDAAFHEKYG